MVEQPYDPIPGQAEAPENNISSSNLDRSATANDMTFLDHEVNDSLADHSSYHSTAHIGSTSQTVTNGDDLLTQGHHVPQAPVKTYGMPRRKKHLNETDLLAVIVVLLCFIGSAITISPRLMVAWRLGLKRQLQIIGFLLSIMNLCLNVIAPKIFLMSETRFGHSYIQNYDAILRSSIVLSHTDLLWRAVLLVMIALPNGLSVAYKEFIEGSHNYTLKDTGGYYGVTAPGQLATVAGHIGVSLMINSTLPFVEASANDSIPPDISSLPQAYGFNMLLLSETSTAFLDGPMPDYISSIQATLVDGESQFVSAQVHATISTYNNTAESFRNDSSWWKQYTDIGIAEIDLYVNKSIGLLVSSFANAFAGDKSWCFIGIVPSGPDAPSIYDTFQYTALEFSTRRDQCQGTWIVTRDRVELTSGHCNPFSLPASDQKVITNNTLGFTEYYMPTLSDFLGAFAIERNTSAWLLPTFTTTVAAMYWSRITSLNGYYSIPGGRGANLTDPQLYYQAADTIVSTRVTMDPSWILYLILAIQPVLVLLLFLTGLAFSKTPLDGGFSIVAILAGVKSESLNILQGASLSGRLSDPVRMQIAVSEPVKDASRGSLPQIGYVIGGGVDNGTLGRTERHRMLRARNWLVGVWARMVGREGNLYEMFEVEGERLRP